MGDRTNFELCVSDAFAEMTRAVLELIGENPDYDPGPYEGCTTFGFEQRKDIGVVQDALEERLIPYDMTDGGYYDCPSETTHCRYDMNGVIRPPTKRKWSYHPGSDGPSLGELDRMTQEGDLDTIKAYVEEQRRLANPEPPIAQTTPGPLHEGASAQIRNDSLIAAARRERTGETSKTLVRHRLILDEKLYGRTGDHVGDDDHAVCPHYLRVLDEHTRVAVRLDGPTEDRVLDAEVRVAGSHPVLELGRDDWPFGLTLTLSEGWLTIDKNEPDYDAADGPPRRIADLQISS